MSKSDTDTDDAEWNHPGTPTTGHAAVGFVTGQRFADGTRPEYVEIEYEYHSNRRRAIVNRVSSNQQVEFSAGSTVRFRTTQGTMRIVDKIFAARPVSGDRL